MSPRYLFRDIFINESTSRESKYTIKFIKRNFTTVAIDRGFDYGVTPRFIDIVLKQGDELVCDAGVGLGAEADEGSKPGTRRKVREVAKEAIPRQERLIILLPGDDLTYGDEGVVVADGLECPCVL